MAWHLLSSQWLWTGLTVALLVSDVLVFILMPRWARRLAAQGQTARAVRVLARVVRLPSVAGDGVKLGCPVHPGPISQQRAALR